MPEGYKRCTKCKRLKPLRLFARSRNRKDGHHNDCLRCHNKETTAWYHANKSVVLAQRRRKKKTWFGVKFYRPITEGMARNQIVRLKVLAMMGGACQCCGETRQEFLTIDHINGGGNRHRARVKGYFYRWLLKHGCPSNRFRLLCANCNAARGYRGYCPHERE